MGREKSQGHKSSSVPQSRHGKFDLSGKAISYLNHVLIVSHHFHCRGRGRGHAGETITRALRAGAERQALQDEISESMLQRAR